MRMTLPAAAVLTAVAVAGLAACSDGVAPRPAPTLLVGNPTCLTACRTVEIRAFVWTFTIPQNPLGSKVVGYVHGASACLQFPPQWTAVVREAGIADSTVYLWTPADPIYLVVLDSVVWHGGGGDPLIAMTPTFAPADAPGWNLSSPADALVLTSSERCDP
jgi:hypothetical protein